MRLDKIPRRGPGRTIRAVVETPKGSRNKFDFEPEWAAFRLSKALPEGMSFPFDFGFVPQTLAEDGDPLDIVVLMDAPVTSGCVVECRLIGALEGRQRENGRWLRNDRLFAVSLTGVEYETITDARRLASGRRRQFEQFFVNYNALLGKKFQPLRMIGPSAARQLLKKHVHP